MDNSEHLSRNEVESFLDSNESIVEDEMCSLCGGYLVISVEGDIEVIHCVDCGDSEYDYK